ncbi:MAG: hypothetical protein ACLU38_07810 [Dysosmobacter sp.]
MKRAAALQRLSASWSGTPVFNAAVTFTTDQGQRPVRQRRSAAGDRRGDLLRAEAPLRLLPP